MIDGTYGADAGEAGDDLMGTAPYTLEVSSPGLDRPLRGYRAFRRNVGRLVAFVLESGDELTARLVSVTEGVTGPVALVEVPAARKQPASRRELALDEVASARVQVEFNRPGAGDEPPDSTDDTDSTDDADSTDEETDDGH